MGTRQGPFAAGSGMNSGRRSQDPDEEQEEKMWAKWKILLCLEEECKLKKYELRGDPRNQKFRDSEY